MKTYEITQATKGYVIRDFPDHRGLCSNELYAFSTLKEAQAYLPNIFEPKPVKPVKVKP